MIREIQVNFLPEAYQQKIGKKNKKQGFEKICQILCLLMVVVGCSQFIGLFFQENRLQGLNHELEVNLAAVNARELIKGKIALIDKELSIQQSLPQKIDIHYVLDAIASSQPLSIGLTNLEIAHIERNYSKKKKGEKLQPIHDVKIMLVGSAPNSDSVKEYVGELESKTIFSNVLVKTVRAVEWDEIEGYTFSVELWIDSDYEYLVAEKGGDVYEVEM